MKRHIIVYGLTQSGVQTANSLIEQAYAKTENTINLGSFFKVAGDRYLSHDERGVLRSHSTPKSASGQPFFQTYRKTQNGIASCFDYAVSRIRDPEEEFQHRLSLLEQDETDTIYVSNISAAHETQFRIPLNELFRAQETEVIILDPRKNLSRHAKNFFAAYQTNIWTTNAGQKADAGQDISFTQETAHKFRSEIELVRSRINRNDSNAHLISSDLLDSSHKFAQSLGLKTLNPQPMFKDAEFKNNWRPSDLAQFQSWIKTLEV